MPQQPEKKTADAPNQEVQTPATAPLAHTWAEPDPKSGGYHWGTGRRKTSIARVRIKQGTGQFKINGREIDNFFALPRDRQQVVAPLDATDTRKRVDVFVNSTGGGTSGQAGAIALGVARALVRANKAYQAPLRDGNFLTRDPREVERKKYGRRGARRSFQFSKR